MYMVQHTVSYQNQIITILGKIARLLIVYDKQYASLNIQTYKCNAAEHG